MVGSSFYTLSYQQKKDKILKSREIMNQILSDKIKFVTNEHLEHPVIRNLILL